MQICVYSITLISFRNIRSPRNWKLCCLPVHFRFNSSFVINYFSIQELIWIDFYCELNTCEIYEGICSCGETYIGETKRNVKIRWMEHNTPSDKSNPAKHLRDNIDHSFTWIVICNASNRKLACRLLEAYFTATMKPSLNDKLDSHLLHFFRNGIT